jgi:phosphonate transport system permease protein
MALLWPGIQLSELDLGVLLRRQPVRNGPLRRAFWPPAHDREFLQLLLKATLQTLAIATAGMALALLLAVPASLLASRAVAVGGVPQRQAQSAGRLLRWPVRGC